MLTKSYSEGNKNQQSNDISTVQPLNEEVLIWLTSKHEQQLPAFLFVYKKPNFCQLDTEKQVLKIKHIATANWVESKLILKTYFKKNNSWIFLQVKQLPRKQSQVLHTLLEIEFLSFLLDCCLGFFFFFFFLLFAESGSSRER